MYRGMSEHPGKDRKGKPSKAASLEWSRREFATLECRDVRDGKRWEIMAADMHASPGASIPEASGDWAGAKGCYRLLEREAFSAQALLESHADATRKRVGQSKEEVILAIQDTTSLNFSNRPQTSGLGPIGGKAESGWGFLAHGTLCVGGGGEEVFGLLGARIWARDPAQRKAGPAGACNRKPIEEKESHRWVEGWIKADELFVHLGQERRVVSVSDREGDIYELFALRAERKNQRGGAADLLVRSKHNRQMCTGHAGPDDPQGSWDHLQSQPAKGHMKIDVPAKPGQRARTAQLEVRYEKVLLRAPVDKVKYLGLEEPLDLWLLIVEEVPEPAGCPPLCWRLWTSVELASLKEAIEVARWYARRWVIEEWHRVLKTGCRVEQRQLESFEKLSVMLVLDMVVACNLLAMSRKARQMPSVALDGWFTDSQWKTLYIATHANDQIPESPPDLATCVNWLARLGGFLARKSDGWPGPEVLWRGLRKLDALTHFYEILKPSTCG